MFFLSFSLVQAQFAMLGSRINSSEVVCRLLDPIRIFEACHVHFVIDIRSISRM